MSKNGGYLILDLKGQNIAAGIPFTLDGVTAKLNGAKSKVCLLSGFTIGNDKKRDVFIDLQKTEDGYVALFGQYTIAIEDDEVTITDGGVLMDNIVDSQGNKRFVEFDGSSEELEGVTITYRKASLSGTHLMLVVAGTIAANTRIRNDFRFGSWTLPAYILDKIAPTFNTIVEMQNVVLYANDWTQSSMQLSLRESQTGVGLYHSGEAFTPAKDYGFRIEFDLLIDTAVAE